MDTLWTFPCSWDDVAEPCPRVRGKCHENEIIMTEYVVQSTAPRKPHEAESKALRNWGKLCILIAVAIFGGCYVLYKGGCEWPVLLALPALAAIWISYEGGL